MLVIVFYLFMLLYFLIFILKSCPAAVPRRTVLTMFCFFYETINIISIYRIENWLEAMEL